MKKNKMLRLAAVILVLTLLSTSVISGTFAKYVTSDDATDSARVAKWGVTVVATGDEAFAEKYNDAADAAGIKVVSSVSGQDVLAPGTHGTLGGIKIEGTPEVMVDITVTAELALDGWEITGDWDNDPDTVDTTIEYCPIVFTVGGEEIKMTSNVADLESAVAAKITALAATNVAANTDLATNRDITITWEWDFDDHGAGTNDVKDTALGNLAVAPTISFECEATVTQVD